MKPFLVRSPINELESLRGYALRMTACNEAHALVRPMLATPLLTARALPQLAALTLVDVDALASRLTLAQRANSPGGLLRVGNKTIGTRAVRWRTRHVCAACVDEGIFSSILWELDQVDACDVHKIDLVARCPECEASLAWEVDSLDCCRCQFPIVAFPVKRAHMASVGLARNFRSSVLDSFVCNPASLNESDQGAPIALDVLLVFVEFARSTLEPIQRAPGDGLVRRPFSHVTRNEILSALENSGWRSLLFGRSTPAGGVLSLGRDLLTPRGLVELNWLFAGDEPQADYPVREHLVERRRRWSAYAPNLVKGSALQVGGRASVSPDDEDWLDELSMVP